jgi:hypothetical protein
MLEVWAARSHCSLTLIRFKAWCEHCGHSAACHGSRHFYASGIVMLAMAALLAGSVALFENLR